ncbi:rRNA adenine N-6-methyltransferase family protein [Clostridium sp.]|uniref:rRNA adenine N-6-methyltransferase family protein n=1 Tax=Clostridium sp. TaxID=1506 RepID=UPI0028411AD9|nr:rRNA adenine N-6-methyltransferase family protein [Clostridium sp.]MDR3596048.1 rRNA adenine N-6-methyltransferase family protein [Clostridium sp.]
MKPYNKNFVFQEMKKYNKLVNQGTCGDYKIVKYAIDKQNLQGYMYENKEKYDIDTIQLYRKSISLIEFTPKEIESSYGAISFAYGKVGVVGLGIGYVVQEIAKKTKVKEVIVYENRAELIELYYQNFNENEKIKIIKGDALKVSKEKFDFFYVDMYKEGLTINVVKDYVAFNELHEIEEYAFYGLEHFLLSCKYEDIVWVYIPENWVAMSKKAYEALDASRYIEAYKPLEEEKVKTILLEFKEVLNA